MIIASCVSQVADLPFVRFVVSHAEHALEFLENIYSIYAKSGCDAGADKLKRHSCSIKDLWNYIL